MSTKKMHENEIETSVELVRRLLVDQFPQWADLPIETVPASGTDNALYQLGDDLVVRMPRIDWAVGQAERELEYLPAFAPQLPFPISTPLEIGKPGAGYPWSWSVQRWIAGQPVTIESPPVSAAFARDLAEFITALHSLETSGGLEAGAANFGRGEPLSTRDASTRAALAKLDGKVDTGAAAEAWQAALDAPVWDAPPVWIHGDLQFGNVLMERGRLSAVIDWGCFGIGDPACDIMAAWTIFDETTRPIFRDSLDIDEATWLRGSGWALSTAIIGLPYYWETNPTFVADCLRRVEQVLGDRRRTT